MCAKKTREDKNSLQMFSFKFTLCIYVFASFIMCVFVCVCVAHKCQGT